MDLYTVQFIFYTLGILFMIALIALVAALIYVLFQIKRSVEDGVEKIETTMMDIKHSTVDRVESIISDNKMKIMGTVGTGLVTFLADRLKSSIGGKKRKSTE